MVRWMRSPRSVEFDLCSLPVETEKTVFLLETVNLGSCFVTHVVKLGQIILSAYVQWIVRVLEVLLNDGPKPTDPLDLRWVRQAAVVIEAAQRKCHHKTVTGSVNDL